MAAADDSSWGLGSQPQLTDLKGKVMPSISPIIAHLFDDPHANHRHVKREGDKNRARFETKGRVLRRRSK
jgi:hypothetical protein